MTAKEDALERLERDRDSYKEFYDQLDAELAKIKADRLAQYKQGIRADVLEAYAHGASFGEIKRAYGTKDHRTIKDIVDSGTMEIKAIQKGLVDKGVNVLPDWATLEDGGEIIITVGDHQAVFETQDLGEAGFMFISHTPLWSDDYSVKNEAVELLDGKTEADSAEAKQLGTALRKIKR